MTSSTGSPFRIVGSLLRFSFLVAIKLLSRLFYSFDVPWVNPSAKNRWGDVRLMIMLNHTSLFEPLYIGVIPLPYVWRIANKGIYPGADKTMDRPVAGRFFKNLAPGTFSITRKRDHTWEAFLSAIKPDSLVMMFPEGRMRRRSGLDASGKQLRIKTGIVDVLNRLDDGDIMIGYSQGLHHIQAPGEGWPKLFKTVAAKIEQLSIRDYKEGLRKLGGNFAEAVVADLERRRDLYCPPQAPESV